MNGSNPTSGRSTRDARAGLLVVGRDVPRTDGPSKVTSAAQYVADIQLPGMLHAAVLRSPHPHARIANINLDAARTLPGVKAIVTGADTAARKWGAFRPDLYPLAIGEVRYVGDEVAAIAAVDAETARAAIDRIEVEYEVLPAVLSMDEALAEGADSYEPSGPYGAKGIGEIGLDAIPAAIANAIADAVGVRITELPITAEKIHRALHPEAYAAEAVAKPQPPRGTAATRLASGRPSGPRQAKPEMLFPTSVEEAVGLHADGDAALVCGGTSHASRRERGGYPFARRLIALTRIPELQAHSVDANGMLYAGSAVALETLHQDQRVRNGWPAIADAFDAVGATRIRRMITVGGSVGPLIAGFDLPLALLALRARVHLAGPTGRRCIGLQALFESRLAKGEIVIGFEVDAQGGPPSLAVRASACRPMPFARRGPWSANSRTHPPAPLPEGEGSEQGGMEIGLRGGPQKDSPLPSGEGQGVRGKTASSAFFKFLPRGVLEIPTVTSAALVHVDDTGRCTQARMAVGAVGRGPIVREPSQLVGSPITIETAREALHDVADAANPFADVRGSVAYKRAMAVEFAARALLRAWERTT